MNECRKCGRVADLHEDGLCIVCWDAQQEERETA